MAIPAATWATTSARRPHDVVLGGDAHLVWAGGEHERPTDQIRQGWLVQVGARATLLNAHALRCAALRKFEIPDTLAHGHP